MPFPGIDGGAFGAGSWVTRHPFSEAAPQSQEKCFPLVLFSSLPPSLLLPFPLGFLREVLHPSLRALIGVALRSPGDMVGDPMDRGAI